MSDKKLKYIPALMDLNVTPPEGYSKLPKWNSTRKYRLKDRSWINVLEYPFYIHQDLSHPCKKVYLKSCTTFVTNSFESQVTIQKVPKFTISESSQGSFQEVLSYLKVYSSLKQTKALIVKNVPENNFNILESLLTNKSLLNSSVFDLEKNPLKLVESSFLTKNDCKNKKPVESSENSITDDLDSITQKMQEYYI